MKWKDDIFKLIISLSKIYSTASWNSQMVDNSELTTISDLTPLAIYTIRVQAFTSMGAGKLCCFVYLIHQIFSLNIYNNSCNTGPMSGPVQVKTQQGVPSQPSNFRAVDIGENSVTLQWSKPTHSSENIVHYELYYVRIFYSYFSANKSINYQFNVIYIFFVSFSSFFIV